MPREDKNQNGKRNPITQLIGKKARKISKKKEKLEKLLEVQEKTLQKEKSQKLSFAGISEQRHMELCRGKAI